MSRLRSSIEFFRTWTDKNVKLCQNAHFVEYPCKHSVELVKVLNV